MPKSNWKGVISFGLVTIPVILHPASNKQADISFHLIDKKDNARIKYQRVNSNTGKIVPWENIIRGYEVDEETIIPVPDNILQKIAGDKTRTINIDAFVDKKDVDFLTLENVYYLVPDKNGQKGYVILREALKDTNKAGVAKVVISTREYLSVLIPHQDALMLCLLKYDSEVRKPSEFELPDKELSAYKATSKEITIAKQLIKSMSSKWKPEKFVDSYQQSIHEWVEETIHHLPHKKSKKLVKKPGKNVNFIDLLKKSLATSSKKPEKKMSGAAIHKSRKHSYKHVHKGSVH